MRIQVEERLRGRKNVTSEKRIETARNILNETFPELLLPFGQTEYTQINAITLGLIRFFEHVRSNPDKYPETTGLLSSNEFNNL